MRGDHSLQRGFYMAFLVFVRASFSFHFTHFFGQYQDKSGLASLSRPCQSTFDAERPLSSPAMFAEPPVLFQVAALFTYLLTNPLTSTKAGAARKICRSPRLTTRQRTFKFDMCFDSKHRSHRYVTGQLPEYCRRRHHKSKSARSIHGEYTASQHG